MPPREIGDLYIAGTGLSPGYWRDPQKTASAFIPDPLSTDPSTPLYRTGDLAWLDEGGLVYFVGRADSQIKVRGYRIELGEVETALNSLGRLQECAVVAIPTDNFGGWMICCAYVVRSGDEVGLTALREHLVDELLGALPIRHVFVVRDGLTALREHLKKTVPSYMFPARWVAYDVLPKNPNGKIDRPRLKEHFAQAETASPAPQRSDTNGVDTAGSTGPADATFPIPDRHASQA